MKIFIIGALGAGKSTLAYNLSNKLNISKLPLDRIFLNENSEERAIDEQKKLLNEWLDNNNNWIIEGSHYSLYKDLKPDFIIHIKINKLLSVWRVVKRFFIAKKLLNKYKSATIPGGEELPIQPYHYRKITIERLVRYYKINTKINNEIDLFLKEYKGKVITINTSKDSKKVIKTISQSSS